MRNQRVVARGAVAVGAMLALGAGVGASQALAADQARGVSTAPRTCRVSTPSSITAPRSVPSRSVVKRKCFPLGIEKSGPATATLGDTIPYTITITNNGRYRVPFTSIIVTDPGATDLMPPPDPPQYLGVGKSAVWTASRVATSDACGMDIVNTAWVSLKKRDDDDDDDSRKSQSARSSSDHRAPAVSDAWSTSIVCPVQVSIAKSTTQVTVEPGGTAGYTIAVTNTGSFPIPESAIVVEDIGATVGPPTSAGDLQAGATRTWPASKSVPLDAATCGTEVTNSASVALVGLPAGWTDTGQGTRSASAGPVLVSGGICTPSVPVPPPSGDSTSQSAAAGGPVAFRPASGSLGITKTGPTASLAGGLATFRITVVNEGTADLTSVVLRDQPPASMVLRAVPRGASRTGTRVSWALGTLAPGESVTKVVTVRLLRTTRGTACNVATVSAEGTDSVRARACTTVQVGRRPATPVTG